MRFAPRAAFDVSGFRSFGQYTFSFVLHVMAEKALTGGIVSVWWKRRHLRSPVIRRKWHTMRMEPERYGLMVIQVSFGTQSECDSIVDVVEAPRHAVRTYITKECVGAATAALAAASLVIISRCKAWAKELYLQ
jgi:hypothetical protein